MFVQKLAVVLCLVILLYAPLCAANSIKIKAASCADSKCEKITESYNKVNLPHGYLQITTIPANAANVSVKQLGSTENRLVLKTSDDYYIINGEDGSSPNGTYEHEETEFLYYHFGHNKNESNRAAFETIFATGPLLKPIDLMVLVKDRNPGISLEYFLPTPTNEPEPTEADYDYNYDTNGWDEPETPQDFIKSIKNNEIQEANYESLQPVLPTISKRRRHKYMWKIISFSSCSKSCGGGLQTPIFRCIRDSPTRYYSPRRCMHMDKPVFNENIYKCNMQQCPAFWHADLWGECICTYSEGYQKRDVRCVQTVTEGVVIEVQNSSCSGRRPDDARRCECWTGRKRGSRYSQPLHRFVPLRVNLVTATSHRKSVSNFSTGIWLASDWYSNCSSSCGSGYEYRSIFCDRTLVHSDRCDLKLTPDTARSCISKSSCDVGEWAATDWGQCSGDCFNLQKKRKAFCVKNNEMTAEADCDPDVKPVTAIKCSLDDVDYCRPRWYYSEWSTCSKSCDGGTQRRAVKCLELDRDENVLRESKKCLYVERQPIYSTCNTNECPEMLMDSRVDVLQDQEMTCRDIFKNCDSINKYRFCKSVYYQRHCCSTCREYNMFSNY